MLARKIGAIYFGEVVYCSNFNKGIDLMRIETTSGFEKLRTACISVTVLKW